jgi:hypothetical protein
MDTAAPLTTRVPVLSCSGDMGCHITATAVEGGALTVELEQRAVDPKAACTKCHTALGTKPIPASHHEALKRVIGN